MEAFFFFTGTLLLHHKFLETVWGIHFSGWWFFTNPFETYESKWVKIFPNVRGEHKTYLSCHHLVFFRCAKFPSIFLHRSKVLEVDVYKDLGDAEVWLRCWVGWVVWIKKDIKGLLPKIVTFWENCMNSLNMSKTINLVSSYITISTVNIKITRGRKNGLASTLWQWQWKERCRDT